MDHIHKYERKKFGKSTIYKCILSGCTHFIQSNLVEGRISICSRCDNPFTITKRTLKNCPAKPHCENCYKTSNASKDRDIDKVLDTLIGE